LNSNYNIGDEIIYLSEVQDSAFSYIALENENENGYIEEVRFFVNGVETSVDYSAPYYANWSPVEEGQYEIYSQARDNQGNIGISEIRTIVVESKELKLELFLNSESSFYDGTPFSLDLTLIGNSEDLDDILNLRAQDTLKLYVNGGFYNENVADIPSQAINNNGDITSLGFKLNYTASYLEHADCDGVVSLTGILSNNNQITAVSNSISINIIAPVPWINSDSNLLNLRNDIIGTESAISLAEINNVFKAQQYGNGNEWLASLVEKEPFINKLDMLSVHHVVNGKYHSNYSDFDNDVSTYIINSNQLPGVPIVGSTLWLKSYINDKLQSDHYVTNFGQVPLLVGDWPLRILQNFSETRRNIVNQFYFNKYGVEASYSQRLQGSARLLNQWTQYQTNYWEDTREDDGIRDLSRRDSVAPNNFNAGELAVDLVWQLAKEYNLEGNLPFIFNSNNLRQTHYTPTLLLALILKEEWDGMRSQTEQSFIGKSTIEVLTKITKDPRYIRAYNYIWRNSELLTKQLPHWKREPWFGTFNDESFPWIYHNKLGWLYCASNSQCKIWFYSTLRTEDKNLMHSNPHELGWIWTSDNLFPYVYSFSNQGWNYIDTNSSQIRIYSYRDQRWIFYNP